MTAVWLVAFAAALVLGGVQLRRLRLRKLTSARCHSADRQAERPAAEGEVQQVGPQQDFMGYTVVGPDHYLASGHPGAGQDQPGNLGLIESTDGGTTWQSASLSGEADFHALEARHGRVYGYSGGQLMVSPDTKTWDVRGSLPLADFAVSPDDPDTLLATTEQGLAVSTDGGGTWQERGSAGGQPAALTADGEDVYVATRDGRIVESGDGGRSFEVRYRDA